VLEKGGQVVGISVDAIETLRRFRRELGAPFPILADADGAVARRYAGLVPVLKLAKRANVVVGRDGLVKEVVTGSDAVDPSSAIAACPVGHGGT
jgi:thioredoxin-dependent peroxiredoxin